MIDKGIEGWFVEHRTTLECKYAQISQVGRIETLSERAEDRDIASFCKYNDCDLFTPDLTFFEGYFESGINTVRITKYDWWRLWHTNL